METRIKWLEHHIENAETDDTYVSCGSQTLIGRSISILKRFCGGKMSKTLSFSYFSW